MTPWETWFRLGAGRHLDLWRTRMWRAVRSVGLPYWILFVTSLLLFVATLWVVILLPPPGWPPKWSSLEVDTRVQIAGLIVAGAGAAGVLLSITAGVVEIRTVIPSQKLRFFSNVAKDSDGGPVVAVGVHNGDAFIQFPSVRITAEIRRAKGKTESLTAQEGGDFSSLTEHALRLREGVLYPKDIRAGGFFRLTSAEPEDTIIVIFAWASERHAPSSTRLEHSAESEMGDYS